MRSTLSDILGKWSRRAISIPLYAITFFVILCALPALLILSGVIDVARGSRFALVRLTLFLALFFGCELLGIAASFILWLAMFLLMGARSERFLQWSFRLQCWWGRSLAAVALRLFGVRLHVEEAYAFGDRRIILFIRHVSLVDTILAVYCVSSKFRIQLRYVLKRVLLWDPCLDIVGNRLPNYFVQRESADGAREIQAVGALMDDLGPRQGVLIYPEGTRFTTSKQERALKRLALRGDPRLLEWAKTYRCVLPPRLGGPLELLKRNQGARCRVLCPYRFGGFGVFP